MADLFAKPPAEPKQEQVACRLALDLPNGMAKALLEHGDGRITVATVKRDQTAPVNMADAEISFMPEEALAVAHEVLARPRTAGVHITPKIRALAALVLLLAFEKAEGKGGQ